MIFDANGVPIRAGLCLDCSTRLVWWNGRLRCNAKDVNLKQFPIKSCNGRHPLNPGQKSRPILVVHPDTDACYGNYNKDSDRCFICSRADGACIYETKQRSRKAGAAS